MASFMVFCLVRALRFSPTLERGSLWEGATNKNPSTFFGRKYAMSRKPKVRKERERGSGLTARHLKAIDAYFGPEANLSVVKAMRIAGYAEKTCTGHPHLVFGREDVQKEIQRRRDETAKKYEVTQERLVEEMAKLAFSNFADYIELDEHGEPIVVLEDLTHEQFAALSDLQIEYYTDGIGSEAEQCKRIKIKLHGKKEALDRLDLRVCKA